LADDDAAAAAAAGPDDLGMPIAADGAGRTPLKSGLNGDGGTGAFLVGISTGVFGRLVWDADRLVECAAC